MPAVVAVEHGPELVGGGVARWDKLASCGSAPRHNSTQARSGLRFQCRSGYGSMRSWLRGLGRLGVKAYRVSTRSGVAAGGNVDCLRGEALLGGSLGIRGDGAG